MQYAQRVRFMREIVLVSVYGALLPKARRFAPGQEVIGTVQFPCSDGHQGRSVVTIRCDREDNDPLSGPTYHGDFILANVPEDAITVEDMPG
jgi:hypothetical protein